MISRRGGAGSCFMAVMRFCVPPTLISRAQSGRSSDSTPVADSLVAHCSGDVVGAAQVAPYRLQLVAVPAAEYLGYLEIGSGRQVEAAHAVSRAGQFAQGAAADIAEGARQ